MVHAMKGIFVNLPFSCFVCVLVIRVMCWLASMGLVPLNQSGFDPCDFGGAGTLFSGSEVVLLMNSFDQGIGCSWWVRKPVYESRVIPTLHYACHWPGKKRLAEGADPHDLNGSNCDDPFAPANFHVVTTTKFYHQIASAILGLSYRCPRI